MLETLEKAIEHALQTTGIEAPEVRLEHPAELSHGDYSTNVALAYSKELKMKPRELAEKVVEVLRFNLKSEKRLNLIDRIEIAGPGFINFHLSKEFFAESVKGVSDDFGKNKIWAGKRVMVEFTDPNPFKEFHIGHLMDNAVGESVARIIDFHGAKVLRACWQGDVGLHVAKAIWGYQKGGETENTAQAWGKAYARGSEAFETDENAKKEIPAL